jgi:hypothetical protein
MRCSSTVLRRCQFTNNVNGQQLVMEIDAGHSRQTDGQQLCSAASGSSLTEALLSAAVRAAVLLSSSLPPHIMQRLTVRSGSPSVAVLPLDTESVQSVLRWCCDEQLRRRVFQAAGQAHAANAALLHRLVTCRQAYAARMGFASYAHLQTAGQTAKVSYCTDSTGAGARAALRLPLIVAAAVALCCRLLSSCCLSCTVCCTSCIRWRCRRWPA